MHVWNKKWVSWLFNDWYYSPKTCHLWPFPRDELGWSWIHELLDKVDHDKFHRRAYLSLLVFKTNIFGLNNFQSYVYSIYILCMVFVDIYFISRNSFYINKMTGVNHRSNLGVLSFISKQDLFLLLDTLVKSWHTDFDVGVISYPQTSKIV